MFFKNSLKLCQVFQSILPWAGDGVWIFFSWGFSVLKSKYAFGELEATGCHIDWVLYGFLLYLSWGPCYIFFSQISKTSCQVISSFPQCPSYGKMDSQLSYLGTLVNFLDLLPRNDSHTFNSATLFLWAFCTHPQTLGQPYFQSLKKQESFVSSVVVPGGRGRGRKKEVMLLLCIIASILFFQSH